MGLIEVNINNSFNKYGDHPDKGEVASNKSTLNTNNLDHQSNTSSVNSGSSTNSAVNSPFGLVIGGTSYKKISREVFIAAAGTIIGSIATYFIVSFVS